MRCLPRFNFKNGYHSSEKDSDTWKGMLCTLERRKDDYHDAIDERHCAALAISALVRGRKLLFHSTHATMLKCLKKRAVTGFLPPPGGPHAHTNITSMICRNCKALRSYLSTRRRFQFFNARKGVEGGGGNNECGVTPVPCFRCTQIGNTMASENSD